MLAMFKVIKMLKIAFYIIENCYCIPLQIHFKQMYEYVYGMEGND